MLPENRFTLLNSPFDRLFNTVCDILKAHCSHAVTPRWLCNAKECIQSGWANSVIVASRNLGCGCWSLPKLQFSKIIWRLDFKCLRFNATRRSINLSVYLVFDLEAGRFKFLGEILLGAGGVHFPSWVVHSHFDLPHGMYFIPWGLVMIGFFTPFA